MKPMKYMELLGDLPDDLVDCGFLTADFAAKQSQSGQAVRAEKGGISMKKQVVSEQKHTPIRIGRAGIAAAVAVCIGLNAALIVGISRMKKDSAGIAPASAPLAAPEIDEAHPKYMELVDAMPTGIIVSITNDSEEDLPYHPQFIVIQDGNKVAATELPPVFTYVQNPIPPGECAQQLAFAQLPAGSYTLVNLSEDGETEGVLGHVDFEISSEFDSMVRVPNVRGMQFEEARELIEEKGLTVTRNNTLTFKEGAYAIGAVMNMQVPSYKTVEGENGTYEQFHYDGSGFWLCPGDTVELTVNIGVDGEKAPVPDVVGTDFDAAKEIIQDACFCIDKRTVYDDTVPEGRVIRQEPEPGTEVPYQSYVRVTVSLGKQADAASANTVTVPDFKGMQWEEAKKEAKRLGFIPSKLLTDADDAPGGTVIMQNHTAGENVPEGSILLMYVAKKDGEQNLAMNFRVSEPHEGTYYFCVRNEAQEIIGITYPFRMESREGWTFDCAYLDCSEDNTKAEAYLVNYDTKQEAVIGSYILHPETGTYDIIYEDIEAAFRQLET